MCHIPLENPWKIEKDLLHPTKNIWKSLTHFLPHPKIDGGSKNRSDFMHDAHGLFCWECIGAKPFSFQNVHLLWPLLGFLTNPYVQVLPYFMPSPQHHLLCLLPTPSAFKFLASKSPVSHIEASWTCWMRLV